MRKRGYREREKSFSKWRQGVGDVGVANNRSGREEGRKSRRSRIGTKTKGQRDRQRQVGKIGET